MARTVGERMGDVDAPEDFDIETNELAEFGSDSGSGLESEDEQIAREHYVNVGRSKLRTSAPVGKKYNGSVVSRKQLEENEESTGSEEHEESGDSDLIDGELIDNSDGASEEQDSEKDISHSGSDEELDLDSESASERNTAPKTDIAALLAAERKHIVQRLSLSTTTDALKGYSIHKQQKLFDSLIEARMKIQKSLINANTLPSKKMKEFAPSSSTYKEAEEACYSLLDSILRLRSQLSKADHISSDKVGHPKKRKLEEYVKATAKHDAALGQYRLTVLNKWSSKIQTSSGLRALNDGKFKAIHQSAEQQVANHLMDKERLIKRTKINRAQILPLGYEEEVESDKNEELEEVNRKSRGEMEHIFDDGDFYRILLNDLVDKKIHTSNPTTGLNMALTARPAKLKNLVDTRASKGRKLRYHVQEAIANFDAPRGGWQWNDDQIDEFFASLLGQKVNMNEEDDEAEENGDAVPEGSILIFS